MIKFKSIKSGDILCIRVRVWEGNIFRPKLTERICKDLFTVISKSDTKIYLNNNYHIDSEGDGYVLYDYPIKGKFFYINMRRSEKVKE